MINVGRNNSAKGYPWLSGQPSVLEPVAINPETGFVTVLVDATHKTEKSIEAKSI